MDRWVVHPGLGGEIFNQFFWLISEFLLVDIPPLGKVIVGMVSSRPFTYLQ